MSELIPRVEIKLHAFMTANRGEGPEACPYALGSDAEYVWKDAYYIRIAQLQGSEVAA